jgi:hypothetical protein
VKEKVTALVLYSDSTHKDKDVHQARLAFIYGILDFPEPPLSHPI